jgi:hypothetical protein
MRFAYGAPFVARRLAQTVAKALAQDSVSAAAGSVAIVAK